MKQLLESTTRIYEYMKLKDNFSTLMQVKPETSLVTKHIEGLGFKMRDRGKKTCVVDLKAKEHWKVLLELAYYSLSLSSIFVMESCFSHIATHHFRVLKSKEPLPMETLYVMGQKLADLFSDEHIFQYTLEREKFQTRLDFVSKAGILNYDKKTNQITLSNDNMLDIFGQLGQCYLDTYLIVLLLCEFICGKHIILKRKNIIKELHSIIKTLY